MTQQEILEGNKLCAEFLEWKEEDRSWYQTDSFIRYVVYSEHSNYPHKGLPFHRDWNWLMVVVKKCCESFEHHQFDSEEYYHITEEIFHPDYSLSEFMNADIEAVFERVVQYIKWHNKILSKQSKT